MRVAIIVRRLNVSGGTQRQAVELARSLRALGHVPTLYTFRYRKGRCYPHLIGDIPIVSLVEEEEGKGEEPLPRRAEVALARRIDPKTDLLNPHAEESYRVAVHFKRMVRPIPSVWMQNDMVTKAASFERLWGVDPGARRSLVRRLWHHLADWYEVTQFIKPQDVIAVLDRQNAEWVTRFYGREAVVVRSGVDREEFPYIPRSAPHDPLRILTTGIFFPHRRFEDIIAALPVLASRGTPAELTILGDEAASPAYAAKVRAAAASAGVLDRVAFLGRVSDERLRENYRSADVFVFASHLQSWGLAVFEAMSSGLPVVVSRTAGASEVLSDGENALMVPPLSPRAIADSLLRLARDVSLYGRLSRAGRIFVEQEISWEKYAKSMLILFEKCMSAKKV